MSNENISEKHIQSRIQDSKKNYDSKLNSIYNSEQQTTEVSNSEASGKNKRKENLTLLDRSFFT